MRESAFDVTAGDGEARKIPLTMVHTLVIGSGAAGLNAAVQLRANGVEDVLIVTEGLRLGTSINTGSDKQTYYKLSMCGSDEDSPHTMAATYFAGGSMHGDLALVEASASVRAFMSLVEHGVPFPRDEYGQFVGYKTDHDPRQRATSIGPYTSREMCRALIRGVRSLRIPVKEGRHVVRLLVAGEADRRRIVGALAVNESLGLETFGAENVVFAVGGPGGLYRTSVYPQVHTGAIGLALLEGAKARNLPESQYGLASIKFRWNVSGTYMQVVPRFISTAADGVSDEREFLREAFDSAGDMNSRVFLKGYQWPFDSRKVIGGSSLIDLLVHKETVNKGRRVFLDFRRNPAEFAFGDLSEEARSYLTKSNALQSTPLERLRAMNPGAVELYAANKIDLAAEPLEVAVCAQHNNGGLAANHWWESENIAHLFPVGEVNGSHGVYRPGGSALNAGQVGGFRAAELIAHRYASWTISGEDVAVLASAAARETLAWLEKCRTAGTSWQSERDELQRRMTESAAHVRSAHSLNKAVSDAWDQWCRIAINGCSANGGRDAIEALKNRYLCFAHVVYLEAVKFGVDSGVGSRGSSIVLDPGGRPVHDNLGDDWRVAPEDEAYRAKVLETVAAPDGKVRSAWVERRPIPESDLWFETAWARFRSGEIYS